MSRHLARDKEDTGAPGASGVADDSQARLLTLDTVTSVHAASSYIAEADLLGDVQGHLIGHQGTWRLTLDIGALQFSRIPPTVASSVARKEPPPRSPPVAAALEAVAFAFADIAGVGFISDGGATSPYLCVYRYLRKSAEDPSKRGPRCRQLVLFRVSKPSDLAGLARVRGVCADAVVRSVGRDPGNSVVGRERPLLVLLNPHSGQGRADRLFSEKAAPVLREAGLACQLVRTEFAGHATQLLRDCQDPSESYSGLVIVSGDGLVYEALNGLASRPDWRRVFRRLPFAVLPAGGGNAMAAALAHANGDCLTKELVATAAFNLAKSRSRAVDLAMIETVSGLRRIACLSLNYGLLAQVDLESERFRFMGLARFAFAFVLRMVSPQLRPYRARLSYLPADAVVAASAAPVATDGDGAESLASVKRHLPASLADPLPPDAGWVTMETDFLFILVSLQSHLATDNFYVPPCRPDDGRLYVTWVSASTSKASLMSMFLRVDSGGHFASPDFHCHAAVAFRLEPVTQGQVCIDGERVNCEAMQGELVPGLGTALMP